MNATALLSLAAGLFSLLLAGTSLVRRRPSPATWFFCAGMTALGAGNLLTVFALRAISLDAVAGWVAAALAAKAVVPATWLGFSLTFSRTDGRERLRRWAVPLAAATLAPVALALTMRDRLFTILPAPESTTGWHLQLGPEAGVLNALLLVALVLILLNLEHTFRSAVGTMRWRLKFVILALVVILGTRLYVHSQQLLFSVPDISALWTLDAAALLIGCLFLTVAYTRTGWAEASVYPSTTVIRSSLTVLIVGGYLLVVGVLAQVVGRLGGTSFVQLQTLVVLVALTLLAVVVLSDRARQTLNTFTARHFGKAQHDSVRVWTTVSEQLGHVTDAPTLAKAAARTIADTFDVLSVNIWLAGSDGAPKLAAGTGQQNASTAAAAAIGPNVLTALATHTAPFDLDAAQGDWAETLRQLNPGTFPNGGRRLCLPLRAGDQVLGAAVLADRVNGAPYTGEELELLRCMAAQCTSVLLNLRLAETVARGRELEAFQTMSAFFVHDLKNAAASLNLMLKNLPVHFDDPAFRQDTLRGIGNTARRIDEMIGRLNALRQQADLARSETDLNDVVTEALDQIGGSPAANRRLEPLPHILADRDQLRSVVANLVLNARDAAGEGGRIEVRTTHRSGQVELSVTDNGCGMTEAFLRDSLFRPFQTTKKSGLGIGLFHARAVVQAHGGRLEVDSRVGEGTTFTATFPALRAS